MTDLERADEVSGNICRAYALLGSVSLIIRTDSTGNVRVIAQQLPPAAVAEMLRAAADAYLAQAPDVTNN